MKIDRLIGILSTLLQEDRTTAPELAKRFEVFRRTINRDIEDLCKAGILLFAADYTDTESLVTWLMTFGAKVEVLEPAEARTIIRRNAEETLQLYVEE